MNRRAQHMHLAWESQPLLRSAEPARRRLLIGLLPVAFLAGLLLGLMI
ncbi:hypothetical protein HHL26_04710 [Sphingobium sp. TB-6]|nr:hypothetical protein [Sphingobium sp. TB-6]NML88366.1 hypothetical protein [Sphingobium sp. TB-6]